jgi:RNA polymerase sigma-70 factor, ECF subfamily
VEAQFIPKLHKPAVRPSDNRFVAEQNDNMLVAAAQSGGNSEAFNILVRRHRAKMLRAALRFTRNEADAEDIVQQSFQKAFVHLQQFEGHSSFSTWLTRIAINEALMWLRRRGSTVEVPLKQSSAENGATVPRDFPDSRLNPEDSAAQQEQKEILSAALNKLRPGVRKAIELREMDELSTEEAARLMGISIPAVKARVFHGRKQLQKVLNQWMSRTYSSRWSRDHKVISRNPVPSACS